MEKQKPFFTLKSFTNELRLYDDHLEGEFFGKDLVGAFGNRFYSLRYPEVESVFIRETPDGQVKILEINFDGKPEFEKKHLHPSNLFFRKSRKEDVQKCQRVKELIDYLRKNPFEPEKAVQILYPGKDNETKRFRSLKRTAKLKRKILLFFNIL